MRVTFPNVGNQVADAVCKISDFPCSLYVELDFVIARGRVIHGSFQIQQRLNNLARQREADPHTHKKRDHGNNAERPFCLRNQVAQFTKTPYVVPVKFPDYITLSQLGLISVGVLLSSGAVAFGIISLLPVELILQVGSSAGFAMVFALLIAAIIWNLGTWYLGLPASSSHTLIGSIIGVGIANALINGQDGTSGVD